MPASSPSGATCTTNCSAIRSSASATCRGCWPWQRPVKTATIPYRRSSETTRRRAVRGKPCDSVDLMPAYRASWVLPIASEPIADGWVSVGSGRIQATGAGASPDAVHLGRVAILPALVNAHTHLEVSYLHGRVPRAERFLDWIRGVMKIRRDYPDPAAPEI